MLAGTPTLCLHRNVVTSPATFWVQVKIQRGHFLFLKDLQLERRLSFRDLEYLDISKIYTINNIDWINESNWTCVGFSFWSSRLL